MEKNHKKKIELAEWIQIIMAVILLLTLGVAIWSSSITQGSLNETKRQGEITQKEFEINNRPYLSFEATGLLNLNIQALEDLVKRNGNLEDLKFSSTTTYKLTTTLINVGRLPAKFDISDKKVIGYPSIYWSVCKPDDGIIYPGQKIDLCWYLQWNNRNEEYYKWLGKVISTHENYFPDGIDIINIKITYSQLNSNKNEFYTELQSENYIYVTSSENSKTIQKDIKWKIIGGN